MALSLDEVKILLGIAMGYDNRKMPGDLNLASWIEASHRANWTLAAAIDAVHEHYANTPDFLMPGHVTQRIRVERRQPAPFERPVPLALPPGVSPNLLPSVDDDRPARPGITRAFSRWNTRRARRAPLAEVRADIEAELNAKRPRDDAAGQP